MEHLQTKHEGIFHFSPTHQSHYSKENHFLRKIKRKEEEKYYSRLLITTKRERVSMSNANVMITCFYISSIKGFDKQEARLFEIPIVS